MKKSFHSATQLREKQARLLCSLSGGQDSIVSFFLLFHMKEKHKLHLEILYCHHFWQTKNFFLLALIFNVSFLYETPYNIILPQKYLITENRSRIWRKKIYFRISRLHKAPNLVLGQTLTDNFEQFFSHLVRGTSPQGLSELNFFNSKAMSVHFFSPLFLLNKKNCKQKNEFVSQLSNHQKPSIYFKSKFFIELLVKKKKISTKRFVKLFNLLRIDFDLENKFYVNSLHKRKLFESQFQFSKTRKSLSTIKNNFWESFESIQTCPLNTTLLKTKNHKNDLVFKQTQSFSLCIYSKNFKNRVRYQKPLEKKLRFTISKTVRFYDFPFLNDVTNFSTDFYRNKIRHQLVPLIRYVSNKKFENLIRQFLENLNGEQELVEKEISEILFLLKIKKQLSIRRKKSLENFLFMQKTKRFCNRTQNKLLNRQWYLIQQIFMEYRNIHLTYLQNRNLQNLID